MYLLRKSQAVGRMYALLVVASWGLSVPAVGVACVLLASGAGWAATESPAVVDWAGSEAQRKQWLQGLSMVGSGQWDEAGRLINQLVSDGVSDLRLKRVQDWVTAFTKLQGERRERRLKDYEQYVAWTKEDMRDKKWRRAVATCHRAFTNADDKEAFRRAAFVKELIDGAILAAEEYEKDHKWQNAATIYLYLKEIFPLEMRYRDAIERCQEHIRLEYAYAKDSDWENSVANIVPSMAKEAFKRVHSDYREQPNFKQMVVDALQQMQRMTEEPKLVKVFDKLKDTDEVQEFRDRIQPHLARAQNRSKMSLTDIIEVFDRVLEINNEIGLFPQAVVIREFVHGSFKPLDQFSDMLWPADTEEFNKHTQGKFYGVGISIRKGHGEPIRVVTPLEDTPAYQAGIRPGDMITHINGKPAAPLSITRAVQEITGPPDSLVTLTIKRSGEGGKDERFDVKLKRAEVVIYTVKGQQRNPDGSWKYMIDPENRIGYLRMTNFTDETPGELKAALKSLSAQKMRGLILDLRGNPGGTLKAAVDVSNLFLDGDKQIVSTRDRKGQDMQMSTSEPEGEHYADFPLILLVNESSASASEIVAGALQVHHRALLVGERSFGKGSVQQVLPVSPTRSAFLKLTTARYYLPNGRCLHRDEDSETWGVDPDVEVDLVPKEMYKIASARLKSDILKGTGQDKLTEKELDRVLSTQPVVGEDEDIEDKADDDPDSRDEKDDEGAREDPNDWPEVDAQLGATLLLMRVRIETDQPWPMKSQALASTPEASTGS
ncbi:MAG TPA: S41 family peptidase [Phycisphaerae bacterium]|nr:S41 family peptidase [Phycisphaerae bacterium]HRY70186.1 S41 family peptidase [Phycisphaerae bacterium]HSA27401.1 S41 family peptidase [Phycisphaerae bacterium]